jgi:hypothetical protein
MERWRGGGMEGWRDEGMEGWRVGGVDRPRDENNYTVLNMC